ncbi:hypothetical protein GE09DRAFT_1292736 [Coniochaeta sp. 2T2.1]|nr:hypothetical protein GE09DRAFT_1292736 [Coniochaeta sp. 2T2.1]
MTSTIDHKHPYRSLPQPPWRIFTKNLVHRVAGRWESSGTRFPPRFDSTSGNTQSTSRRSIGSPIRRHQRACIPAVSTSQSPFHDSLRTSTYTARSIASTSKEAREVVSKCLPDQIPLPNGGVVRYNAQGDIICKWFDHIVRAMVGMPVLIPVRHLGVEFHKPHADAQSQYIFNPGGRAPGANWFLRLAVKFLHRETVCILQTGLLGGTNSAILATKDVDSGDEEPERNDSEVQDPSKQGSLILKPDEWTPFIGGMVSEEEKVRLMRDWFIKEGTHGTWRAVTDPEVQNGTTLVAWRHLLGLVNA